MLTVTRLPYKIGITGTIASGKSLVGKYLAEAGVPVLDTDQVVARLYRDDERLKQDLKDTFGPQAIHSSGQVDKDFLNRFVFKDRSKRKRLEQLVHPRVREEVAAFFREKGAISPVLAVLVPLLFEAGVEKDYDEVWTVYTEPATLIERLMKRDALTRQAAQERLAAQMPQDEKVRRAHRVIDNSTTPNHTKEQVLEALKAVREALPR